MTPSGNLPDLGAVDAGRVGDALDCTDRKPPMNFAYNLDGASGVVIKRLKISETFAAAGVYATVTTAGLGGIVKGITASAVDQIGVTVSTGTYSTTLGDAEGAVDLIHNPMAVYKIKMDGGQTAGTALAITTNSAAASGGRTVTITTGDAAPNSPTMDEGTIACVYGANVGQTRKITTVGATTCNTLVPFTAAAGLASGDVFILVPYTPGDTAADNVNTTSNIVNADATIAVGSGADFRPIELEFDFSSLSAARNNSFVYARLVSHVHGNGT